MAFVSLAEGNDARMPAGKLQMHIRAFERDGHGSATMAMYKAMCAQKGRDGLTGLGDVACWYNDKHGELQVVKGTARDGVGR